MSATKQQNIEVSKLHVDSANVRHIDAGVDPAFVASIQANGVELPLIVRPNGVGFLVIDGGKRLAACRQLIKDGVFKPDYQVPCIVHESATDAEAREKSLRLNVIRRQMHPVDEYRAFAELNNDKKNPVSIEDIAKRFGLKRRHVEQRLALGALDDSVLDAWRDGTVTFEAAQGFTLCSDKKAQAGLLKRLAKNERRVEGYAVKQALKVADGSDGRMLNVVGIDAYKKRGGTVQVDLFGDNHIVSDKKLLASLAQEKIAETIKRLLADGWAFADHADNVNDHWSYGRTEVRFHANAEETKRLKEAEAILEAGDMDEDASETLSEQCDKLRAEISQRSYTKEQKAKSGCFVQITRHGVLQIDYGRTKPKAEDKAKFGIGGVPAGKKAKPKAKAAGDVSNALNERLSEQLTGAAAIAIAKQPTVAMAAMLAGFASHDPAVDVKQHGLHYKKHERYNGKATPAFAGVFETLLANTPGDLQSALALIAGQALDFRKQNSNDAQMKDKGVALLCNTLDAKALNKAIRATFDAKDYFDSVGRKSIVGIVTEAMGGDHASKVGKMSKPDAAKFAVANVPKTGWLPVQLRTSHYDGPVAKTPAPASKKTAGKPKTKGKAKTAKKTTGRESK